MIPLDRSTTTAQKGYTMVTTVLIVAGFAALSWAFMSSGGGLEFGRREISSGRR
ncbi:hypothetical protein [Williamsia phyllosphaerae]|uniref:Uncharacterized protein n=1 Tax=Williamsia phyllosphaerae TaxID=885042 RepID=A0ABQ1UIG6_9NOCA|nr:hypothetical protein [Williamsia phyllosphaerae]GGF17518.1 hypothetical protein GCM10007298_11900 [Williamsia phyllosphaerae]